jgi:hypothetical protein
MRVSRQDIVARMSKAICGAGGERTLPPPDFASAFANAPADEPLNPGYDC